MTALQTGDYVLTLPRTIDGGWWSGRHLVSVGREKELRMYRIVSARGTVRGDGWVTIEHVSGGAQFEVQSDVLIPVSVLILDDDTRHEGRVPLGDDGLPVVALAQCGHCHFVWNDELSTQLTPPPSGRCPNEYNHVHMDDEPGGRHPQTVNTESCVMLVGSPGDGFRVYGPFDTSDDAISYAEHEQFEDTWFVLDLNQVQCDSDGNWITSN